MIEFVLTSIWCFVYLPSTVRGLHIITIEFQKRNFHVFSGLLGNPVSSCVSVLTRAVSGVLNSVRNLGAIKDAAGREAGSKGAQKAEGCNN